MRTYDEIAEQGHEYFDELDQQILELESHAAELREKIERKSGFGIGNVKTVSALRMELDETNATLDRAKHQRNAWVEEFSEGMRQELGAIRVAVQKELSETYAPKVQELADSFDRAREILAELDAADKEQRDLYQGKANQIKPFVTKETREELSRMFNYITDFFVKKPEGSRYDKVWNAIRYNK